MPLMDAVMTRLAAILFAVVFTAFAAPAQAGVVITVDKSAQRLTVEVDGMTRYQWPVSTGRWGYNTPNGSYRPQWLARKWFSRKYDWSPMPHSIFFNGGYAIHGSYEISRLGRPASHGCIRLHPQNAATLFSLVQANMRDTRIVVTGSRPERFVPEVREMRPVPRDRRAPASFEQLFGERPGAGPRF
jgi:lipoprotein-anchoring transpeptidase ErfK/SrfK